QHDRGARARAQPHGRLHRREHVGRGTDVGGVDLPPVAVAHETRERLLHRAQRCAGEIAEPGALGGPPQRLLHRGRGAEVHLRDPGAGGGAELRPLLPARLAQGVRRDLVEHVHHRHPLPGSRTCPSSLPGVSAPTDTSDQTVHGRRGLVVLVLSNLLGGVGVASGVAVGGLLAEALGGTAMAGLGQATSVLGAAVAAVPLAGVAAARGRRTALALGYVVATAGAVVVLLAAVTAQLWLLLVGLGLFGVSTAANLQSRYAAAEQSTVAARGRAMSVVIWATTVGAVAGPNLTAPGDRVGLSLGLPPLAGPYVFSVVAFALGALVVALLFPSRRPVGEGRAETRPALRAGAALRWAGRHPEARFAVVVVACAHAVMVLVMVMTPVHMTHRGMSLELVGVVISLHVLGMYALSPVFGAAVDRWGARPVAWLGLAVLGVAAVLGYLAGGGHDRTVLTAVALTVLGVGW